MGSRLMKAKINLEPETPRCLKSFNGLTDVFMGFSDLL